MQITATNSGPVPIRQAGSAEVRAAVHVVSAQSQQTQVQTQQAPARETGANHYFSIQTDPTTNEIVVRLMDGATGQVIRQIPAEEMLKMARAIAAKIASQNASHKIG